MGVKEASVVEEQYRGFYFEETPEGAVRVYESVEDWMLRDPVYIADNEHLAKLWVDLLLGEARVSIPEQTSLDVPLQLEVDINRGVLYLHSLLTGQTLLRVCRIPNDLMQLFASGMVAIVIDLKRIPMRKEGPSTHRRTVKTDPVYLSLPDSTVGDAGKLFIKDSMGRTHFEFTSVPDYVMKQLWTNQFADITIGVTGR